MSNREGWRPHIDALLAVLRGDLDAARAELDLLTNDDLVALQNAGGDLDVEAGWMLAQRGRE